MSGTVTDSLNLSDLVARIERNQEETRKFVAEQHKLTEEAAKFAAEARKLTWDARLLPWFQVGTMLAATITAAGAIITAGVALWKVLHP